MTLPLTVRPRPGARRRVLGVDPGTHCGWAVVEVAEAVAVLGSGCWELGTDEYVRRWGRLVQHLRDALALHRPDLVAFERVHHQHAGGDAARVYWSVVATVELAVDAAGLRLVPVTVGRVKQRATGKGNADKAEVRVAAERHLARLPGPDEADALFVALAAADDTAEVASW